MEYENVVYVTPDLSRNAPMVVDHRTGARIPTRTTQVVTAAPAAAAPGTIQTATGPYQYQYGYPAAQSAYYAPATLGYPGYPVNPPYVMPQPMTPASNLATILGGFGDIGTLANILAQAFAAFLPLPASPTPQDNNDNDFIQNNTLANTSNLIRYQSALAQFARRDQQILTLGSVLKELFRRPGTVMG